MVGTVSPVPSHPTMNAVHALLAAHGAVLAVDEVGRGAAAGPCTVGVLLCTDPLPPTPVGLADSKLLSPAARQSLVPTISTWLPSAVGHATAVEVDEWGISLALTLAFRRALASLTTPTDTVVLLDGSYDWANTKNQLLLPAELQGVDPLQVSTLVKGDLTCAAIAAASILAKVSRDAMMLDVAARYKDYGFESNMGYLTPAHVAGLKAHGFTAEHRRSWSYDFLD